MNWKRFFFRLTLCVSFTAHLVIVLWAANEGGPLAPEPFEYEICVNRGVLTFLGVWCVYLIGRWGIYPAVRWLSR